MRQGLSDEDMSSIENLFCRTLEIRNATIDNLVVELGRLRESGCEEDGRILDLYRYMYAKLPLLLPGIRYISINP
jgi:hypothetical protein